MHTALGLPPVASDHWHAVDEMPEDGSGDVHDHGHGPHRHPVGSLGGHSHGHAHEHRHGHSHGLVDRSILRSRDGVRSTALSLGVLGLTAAAQAAIFVATGSVALLADLIHNAGDALTAVPLGLAFWFRSYRGEKLAGYFVVLAIFVSACVALYESVMRLIDPQPLSHLWALAAAGLVGFLGNEIAAHVRLRGGKRLHSPALIADGKHAKADGYVSLGVVASALLVAAGADIADPLVGLAITAVILRISWDSWRTVSDHESGANAEHDRHGHDRHNH